MNEKIKSALEFADYHKSLTVQRQFLKEKLDSDLTFGYSGGIFKIDQSLITFTKFLIDCDRIENVPIIDANKNPIIVKNLTEFHQIILDKYFSATHYYVDKVEELKKARSIKDLGGL